MIIEERSERMLTESQKRAKEKYNKKVTKITVEFYPQETELLEKVKSQPSQQGYIKELIRKDLQ